MAKLTLDRSRDFGSVFNDPEGRVYEQDGKFFDGQGNLWRGEAPADAKAPAAPPAPADDQLNKQIAGT